MPSTPRQFRRNDPPSAAATAETERQWRELHDARLQALRRAYESIILYGNSQVRFRGVPTAPQRAEPLTYEGPLPDAGFGYLERCNLTPAEKQTHLVATEDDPVA